MVANKISNFGGMIPAVDELLLPEANAVNAVDAWVMTGTLEGIWEPTLLYTAQSANTRRIFRIPLNYYTKEHLADAFFMEFTDQNTDVLHAPTADDTFDRYYWVSPSQQASYNTHDRILASEPPFLLGVPTPETAPVITIAANEGLTADATTFGTTGYPTNMWIARIDGTIEYDAGDMNAAFPTAGVVGSEATVIAARAYLYTWVTTYGEEGPPSPPTTVTASQDADWRIELTPPLSSDSVNRSLATVNIYRTITGSDGSANYYFVDSVPIGTTEYIDGNADVDIVGHNTLISASWTPPPDDLEGWVMMANGMIVGWRSNEIWFCEPYRPHAWPTAYTLLTQHPIVGMGVVNNTLIILTVSNPYSATGVNPGAVSMTKIDAIEPCLSRQGIVATTNGILYPSPNGLMVANPMYGIVQNTTEKLLTKDEWNDNYTLEKFNAARFGSMYYAFGNVTDGVFQTDSFQNDTFQQQDFSGANDGILISPSDARLALVDLTFDGAIYSVSNDVWTGEVIVQSGLDFYWINQSGQGNRRPYTWRSKKFQINMKDNFECMRVFFTVPPDVQAPFNPRVAGDPDITFDDQMYGVVRVFIGTRLVMARELRTPGEFWRLPSGFKSEFWQVEIQARVFIKNVQLASTAKELASV